MYRASFILIFLLAATALLAQSNDSSCAIRGNVCRRDADGPLAGAIVRIVGTKLGTASRLDGSYRIGSLHPGQYRLRISAIDMVPIDTTVSLDGGDTLDINFSMENEYIECTCNALKDISNGKSRLLVGGGIAPRGNSDEDDRFERRYGINYWILGCVVPPLSCIDTYNEITFRYLDAKFGTAWRTHVRRDVIGVN